MILHLGYQFFLDIFWTISSATLAHISWRLQSHDRLNLLSSKIVRMPSPFQSNCDAHDTITNGQYGVVWSMEHTQQVCVRMKILPSNVWQQFFGRFAFLRQQETDLPPAELWCACSFLLIGQYIFCRRVILNSTSPCHLLHIPVVF
ncbi:hypothetical protein TNCV_1796801 [Trichonephila clavipes]|nr:hypothetical protein TNCV_1796801 [Trichonephila clavipes]